MEKSWKRTLIAQRRVYSKEAYGKNFINNYLNFIKQNADINVNETLIESTLSTLRRTS